MTTNIPYKLGLCNCGNVHSPLYFSEAKNGLLNEIPGTYYILKSDDSMLLLSYDTSGKAVNLEDVRTDEYEETPFQNNISRTASIYERTILNAVTGNNAPNFTTDSKAVANPPPAATTHPVNVYRNNNFVRTANVIRRPNHPPPRPKSAAPKPPETNTANVNFNHQQTRNPNRQPPVPHRRKPTFEKSTPPPLLPKPVIPRKPSAETSSPTKSTLSSVPVPSPHSQPGTSSQPPPPAPPPKPRAPNGASTPTPSLNTDLRHDIENFNREKLRKPAAKTGKKVRFINKMENNPFDTIRQRAPKFNLSDDEDDHENNPAEWDN